jgi:hypothetical protein
MDVLKFVRQFTRTSKIAWQMRRLRRRTLKVDDKLTAEGSGNDSRRSARSGACRSGSHKPHLRYDIDQAAVGSDGFSRVIGK